MIRGLFVVLFLALPGHAFACACCAEPGERSDSSQVLDDFSGLFDAMDRAETAHLFTTACGMDCVKGIEQPEDSYGIETRLDGRVLHLTLSGKGTTGSLSLALPDFYQLRKTDRTPEPKPMALLFTEFQLSVVAEGTGAFNTRPTLGTLVLSGEGNHCMTMDQASHWSLTVEDAVTDFRLFGPVP